MHRTNLVFIAIVVCFAASLVGISAVVTSNTVTAEVAAAPGELFGQWAVTATASSSYSGYGPEKATGAPDTTICDDLTTAWAPLNSEDAPEWLRVGFDYPVHATQVRVHETHIGGFITAIELVEPDGTKHNFPVAADETSCPGWFEMDFTQTEYLVTEVIVHTAVDGWEEIDAVELIGEGTPPTPTSTLTATPVPTGEVSTYSQWAISATASSEFSAYYAAEDATGAPNASQCGGSGQYDIAWVPWTTGSNWLRLRYEQAVYATQVRVRESHRPGLIVSIDLVEDNGTVHTFPVTDDNTECPGYFVLDIEKTTYRVREVIVHTESDDRPAIDAVELTGEGVPPTATPTITPTVTPTPLPAGVCGMWAETAIASSEYRAWSHTASEATGPPNVTECLASSNENAWWPSTGDPAPEWLRVSFPAPLNATQIRIRESWTPGFITAIDLVEPDGTTHSFPVAEDNTECLGDFVMNFNEAGLKSAQTPYQVAEVVVHTAIQGYEGIDAVRLEGEGTCPDPTPTPTPTATATPTPTPTPTATTVPITYADCDHPKMTLPQAECHTLVDIYNATDGPSWNTGAKRWFNYDEIGTCAYALISTGQLWSGLYCRCEGGSCDEEGNVARLGTSSYTVLDGLSGSLPDLTALTELEEISLSNSTLVGHDQFPSNILKTISISTSSPFTLDASKLPASLEILSFSGDSDSAAGGLMGTLGDLSHTSLRRLTINSNSALTGLSSNWPAMLKEMNLNLNGLTMLPTSWPAALETLLLRENQLSDIPDFPAMPNLTTIDFRGNQLIGQAPGFASAPKLASLEFGDFGYDNSNQITSLPNYAHLGSLLEIDLRDNSMEVVPDPAQLPTSLEVLNMPLNGTSGSIPDLSRLHNLKTLNLAGNELTGPVPGNLPDGLEELYLSANQLSGTLPTTLPSALRQLGLNDNQFTGHVPSLAHMANLEGLYISENPLTGGFPTGLGPAMHTLWVSETTLDGPIPDLSGLTQLEMLVANNTQFSGPIPPLPASLKTVELKRGDFSGPVPTLTGLNQLTRFDASYNGLEGTLPDYSHMASLELLYLIANKLSGSLPAALPPNIERMSVASNQLSGIVPEVICETPNGIGIDDNMFTGAERYCPQFGSQQWIRGQTIAPHLTSAEATTHPGIFLRWDHIGKGGDVGGTSGKYEIWRSEQPGGPYTYQTATYRWADGMKFWGNGLQPETTYYVVVRAVQPANETNPNELITEWSNELMVTTGREMGTIRVRKETIPNDSTATFMFSGALEGEIGHEEWLSAEVEPGTHVVTETVSAGWKLTTIDCDEGAVIDLDGGSATYTVTGGADIVCVFTNTEQSTPTITPTPESVHTYLPVIMKE